MASNKLFLACNYSNQKVKNHFNKLKQDLEREWPIRAILIDKERANASKDFWNQIRNEIFDCALAVFDVSAFRPNVVLELGYALALKGDTQILITVDERKPRQGDNPEWLLSDISHLHRIGYKQLQQLDGKLKEHMPTIPAIRRFQALYDEAKLKTSIPEKYAAAARLILHRLRDVDTLTDQQFESTIKGTNVQSEKLAAMLKRHKLARRNQGPHGRWQLRTD